MKSHNQLSLFSSSYCDQIWRFNQFVYRYETAMTTLQCLLPVSGVIMFRCMSFIFFLLSCAQQMMRVLMMMLKTAGSGIRTMFKAEVID